MLRAAELALSPRRCGLTDASESSEHARAPESGDSASLRHLGGYQTEGIDDGQVIRLLLW